MSIKPKQGSKREKKDRIKWRGHEIVRIEAFSDAVFAFAVTLLIVSLEVPKNLTELLNSMRGFIPFGICFTFLFMIWYAQNIFFRRFGVHDIYTVVLNAILIFFVLMYVYPLKFLFSAWMIGGGLAYDDTRPSEPIHVFYMYSGGFACIYLIFALLYLHVLRIKEDLELTAIEMFETKTSLYQNMLIAVVGFLSVIISSFGVAYLPWAGFIYIIIGPTIAIMHKLREKLFKKKFGLEAVTEGRLAEVAEEI
ncbi:MAG: TMEM175 family protein [Flavipsychrobacter sp.]|nr:TMEM175 family protein [Flavipsychrobacter sp.]